jgi:acetyl-CoA C-acetyltransferase
MGNIKDKVAIIGMGCTPYGDLWKKGVSDLIIDCAYEAYEDAGVGPKDIEAVFVGNVSSSMWTGATVTEALQLDKIPATRVENNCATAAEALRVGAFSVAAGMYDTVLCLGFEKLKDYGSGALEMPGSMHPITVVGSAPASFAKSAVQYFEKYKIPFDKGKEVLSKIAVKNHANGALHPKAHFRRAITLETALKAPMIAWPLGLFDCCPVTDGASAAIITRADKAKSYTKDYVLLKGAGLAVGRIDPFKGKFRSDVDITFWDETWAAAQQAYDQVGIKDPRKEIGSAEVHDCFTITELIIYESLGFCPRGSGPDEVEKESFTLKGDLPVNTDGGLKSFGHPVGASGLRMVYELYNQQLGRAGERQLKNPKLGLAHSQGGTPGMFQASVTIVGPAS